MAHLACRHAHAFIARRVFAASSRARSRATNVEPLEVWARRSRSRPKPRRSTTRESSTATRQHAEVDGDDEKLKTWRRLLADVPLARVLPRDAAFGVDANGRSVPRDGAETERLAFFGDKVLNHAVAMSLYAQQVRMRERPGHEDDASYCVGQMSTLVASARSNKLFTRLLARLLRDDMIAAVPPGALEKGRAHSVGTMIEAAVFLVHEGSDEGQTAVDEVGLFLLEQAEEMAAEVFNFKGEFYELVAKGVEGEMEVKTLKEDRPDEYFMAYATLDGVKANARGRNKLEAEHGAAKAVLERLVSKGGAKRKGKGGGGGGGWAGTSTRPVPPPCTLKVNWPRDRENDADN